MEGAIYISSILFIMSNNPRNTIAYLVTNPTTKSVTL